MRSIRLLGGWLLLAMPSAALAESLLVDTEALGKRLRQSPACCVVDARAEPARQAKPLPGAVIWGPLTRIAPAGPVVLVGDEDAAPLTLARTIEKRFKAKQVLSVKGGAEAWLGLMASGAGATGFVIPMNTCEQGKPLQKLRFDQKP